MYDLHTHTLFSDGVLIPSELIRRYEALGAQGVAITDHADASNIDSVVPSLVSFCMETSGAFGVTVIPGCELTHIPKGGIKPLVDKARMLGAQIVLVHGETIVEPVWEGTNREAIESGADALAHPGLITDEDAQLAKEKNVCLELTSRPGHNYGNGHVLRMAQKHGARLVFSTDSHAPGDLLTREMAMKILRGVGLDTAGIENALEATKQLFLSKCA